MNGLGELRAVDGVARPEEEVGDAEQADDGRVEVEESDAPVECEPFPEEKRRDQHHQHHHGENPLSVHHG